MFIFLKSLHFLALLMGGAATIAPMVMLRAIAVSRADGPVPAVALSMRILGILGFLAIIILWVTGIFMISLGYDGASLGVWFVVKLFAAGAIFAASAVLNLLAARAARTGVPPNPAIQRPLITLVRLSLLIAVISAAIVFS